MAQSRQSAVRRPPNLGREPKPTNGRKRSSGEASKPKTIDFDTLPGRDCSLVLSINENDFNAIDSVVTAEQGSGPGIDEEPF